MPANTNQPNQTPATQPAELTEEEKAKIAAKNGGINPDDLLKKDPIEEAKKVGAQSSEQVSMSLVAILIDAAVNAAVDKVREEYKKQAPATATTAPNLELPNAEGTFPKERTEAHLYGNKDEAKEFDLSKLLPYQNTLPKDRIIIVEQVFPPMPSGDVVEDKKSRRAQYITKEDYELRSKPNQVTGMSVLDQLYDKYTVVHNPFSK